MILILYNNNSGGGKGKKIAGRIQQILFEKDIPYTVFKDNEWPDQLIGYQSVWLIGGDGTINYFINYYPELNIPLAIFPGGTGNDYYSNIQNHENIDQLVSKYLKHEVQSFDIGICNGQKFVNTIGIGFDGEVLKDMNLARWVGGHLGYLLVVIKHLFTFKEKTFSYYKNSIKVVEKLLLFFISNAPTTGGGFIISPNAKVNDGHLQIVIAKPTPVWQRLFLLPRVEKGTHLSHSKVNHWATKSIKIEMEEQTFYQIDGELRSALEFEIKLAATHISICI